MRRPLRGRPRARAGARALPGAVLALALVLGIAPGLPGGPAPARAAEPTLGEASHAGRAPGERAATTADPVPRVVWRGPRRDRVVALTFDDGWNAGTLASIYRTLVREQVPATFFVTGMYIRRAPDLWRRIGARFPIANHSNLHRDTRALDDGQVVADLVRTKATVERATGRPMLPYFRPPYGYRNARTDRLAAAAGFPTIVMWDATATDTVAQPTTRGVVRSASAGRAGSIVLLHAGPRVTARALPAIIARYRARGFRFVTLPELIGVRWPSNRTTPTRSLDRLAAAASPAAAQPSVAPPTAGGDPEPIAEAPAPAAPAPVATSRPARERAWARSDGTPGALAAGTGVVLVVLVLVAAAAGRGRRPEDDPAP